MAICNSIPAEVADQISGRLSEVANMLRALRTVALSAENDIDREAACVVAGGLCERSHLILDSCIMKMGMAGLGNFLDNEWESDDLAAKGSAL